MCRLVVFFFLQSGNRVVLADLFLRLSLVDCDHQFVKVKLGQVQYLAYRKDFLDFGSVAPTTTAY